MSNKRKRTSNLEEVRQAQSKQSEKVLKPLGLPRKFNNWLSINTQVLSGWSSVVTIISFPLIFLGLIIGYFQIKDILSAPRVELEFVHQEEVAYKIINNSDKIAENVLVAFGIFDLDGSINNPLQIPPIPIPSISYDWVNNKSAKGPFTFLRTFGQTNHRYFGIIYISCKGCGSLETYWIYVKHMVRNESFYAKRNEKDTFNINMSELLSNTGSYLQQLVPPERRTYIRD